MSDLRALDDKTPIIFMGYYNPFFKYGIKKFLNDASVIGVDGLIIPDLPSEESMSLSEECKNVGIHLIPLLAPTSTEQRIEAACSIARGFIYCVSLTGVTGARTGLSTNVKRLDDNILICLYLLVLECPQRKMSFRLVSSRMVPWLGVLFWM